MMGDIGFGDQGNPGGSKIHHITQEFDDLMGLGEMHAFGSGLRPDIGHRVKAEEICAFADVKENALQHLQKNGGVSEIQVHLIRGEGGPYESRPMDGLVTGEDIRGPGPEDLATVRFCKLIRGLIGDEKISVGRVSVQELQEHLASSGTVVDDSVKHEIVVTLFLPDVLPGPQPLVHSPVIHDGKTPV